MYIAYRLAMDAKSEQGDQDTIPSLFNLGEPVLADFEGNKKYHVAVICPNFGTNEKCTKVKNLKKKGLTHFFHVQRFYDVKRAWLPWSQLENLNHEMLEALSLCDKFEEKELFLEQCQKVIGKPKEELLEICRVRAETSDSFKTFGNSAELAEVVDIEFRDVKTENIELKFQLKGLQCKFEQFVNSQNQNKPIYEQESESNLENQAPVNTEQDLIAKIQEESDQLKNDLKILNESQDEVKKSFQDLKNIVMSQNMNKPHSERESTSANENTEDENQNFTVTEFENAFEFEMPVKKIKLEDQNEEIQKLKQVIEDLRKDVMKLSEENATLSKANDEYEEKQVQNETIVKSLKEDNLKLHQEILDLKYVRL